MMDIYEMELLEYFQKQENISFTECQEGSLNPQILLLSNHLKILKLIPREFIIKTNNGSCNFNIELLKNTSFVIFKLLEDDPDIMEYNLDINDEENTLEKFEQLYQGELVTFNEDELLFCKKLTKLLQITRCPNFMLVESLKKYEHTKNYIYKKKNLGFEFKAQINITDLHKFLVSEDLRFFRIKTNKKDYKCSILGIYSSDILRKLLTENPTIDKYEYDYDDEFNQFQVICDLFNFEAINFTRNNIDSIKEISENLQVTLILDQVNEFISNSEKVSQTIEEQQIIVESIDNLFDLLYNIKEITVERVKMSIIMSDWSKTEDGVKELVAFILQVIKTDYKLHQFMLELILQLEKEADSSNKLDTLMPFLVKQLMNVFDVGKGDDIYCHIFHSLRISLFNCCFQNPYNPNTNDSYEAKIKISQQNTAPYYAFIYKLYKNGIISKENLYKKLSCSDDIYSYLWFLPEMIEIKHNVIDCLKNRNCYIHDEILVIRYIGSILKDKIELYKKVRDFGEPEDKITRSLCHDDVDTFQKIVTKLNCDIQNSKVPFNLYENYIVNGVTNYIDYAAAHGSIKCFKYLLLNHCEIDTSTFSYAVFGGNVEIIKIVDQLEKSGNFSYEPNNKINKIIPAIMKHRNDIFDWILDQKFTDQDNNDIFSTLIDCSIFNGNAHSLLEIFDKRSNSQNDNFYINAMNKSALNGFYRLSKLLFNFGNFKSKKEFEFNFNKSSNCFAVFENISILNLFIQLAKQNDIINCLIFAIKNQYKCIVKCIIQQLSKEQLEPDDIFQALSCSINLETNEFFDYLMEQVIIIDPKFFITNRINNTGSYYYYYYNDARSIDSLLVIACKCGNIKAVEKLNEYIIKNKMEFDFTESFRYSAASNLLEICKFYIEQNLQIDFEKVSTYVDDLGLIDEELFYAIINKVSPEAKENLYSMIYQVIKKKNKKLAKILLKESHVFGDELIVAVSTDDLELVNIILDHNSQPYFINKISSKGTALTIATTNNNLEIVKRLLSIPGINPNLYNEKGATPLMKAIENYNIEIFNTFIEYYGENIQAYKWQIEKAIENYLLPSNNAKSNDDKKNSILIHILELKFIDFKPFFNSNTPLTYACSINNIELVLRLLKNDNIDANLYELNNGDTPLIISIKNNNLDLVRIFVDHPKVDINQKNFQNQSPLIVAVIKNYKEIIEIILNNDKFDPIKSSFNQAFYLSNGDASIQLITSKFQVDVNYKQIDDKHFPTALLRAVDNSDIEKIDLIFQHHSFDKVKSQFNKAIKISIERRRPLTFKKLIDIVDGININENNYLCIANDRDIIKIILNHKTFDSKKSDILKAFNTYFSKIEDLNMINILTLLYEYDQEHDKLIDLNRLLANGHSYLTDTTTSANIAFYVENSLFEFLLSHDADPNMPDKFGVYPLQHAINIEKTILISLLLESDRFDFNKKISLSIKNDDKNDVYFSKESTYLHLAASKRFDIFYKIADKKKFDVNVTNDLGDTPLIVACLFKQKENIKYLFSENDLDYLHRNKSGKTALDIVFPESINGPIIDDKNKYRDLLISKL